MTPRVEVATVGEMADGEMKTAEVGDRTIVLLNVAGDLFAIDDECTHQGCSLSDGDLSGDEVTCPCHGSVFNVKTGEVLQGPAQEPAPTYPLQVEGEIVYIEGA